MLKKNPLYLLLVIFPILLFFTGYILRDVQGPYYVFFYDPSYVYLINALNLAQLNGYGVGHFDHPGTPVQIIGAIVVKIYHWISNKDSDMVIDVLTRPEAYLYLMNKVLVIINCIGLFLLGLFTYKITKSISLSLLIQLSPFASTEIYFGLIIVTPENFLIFVCLCFIAIVIYYLYKIDFNKRPSIKFVLMFAVICGLGFATKLNFLPLIIIPLMIIKGFKNRMIFLIVTVISFFVFIFPALSNFDLFLVWIKNLFINSGKYGKGEANIVNTSSFVKNVVMIFTKDYVFGLSYLCVILTLLANKFLNKGKDNPHLKKSSRVLLGVFIAFSLQILLVGKHYSQYYMLPSFMLSIPAFALSAYIIFSIVRNYRTAFKLDYLVFPLAAITLSWGVSQIILSYKEGDEQRNDAMEAIYFIKNNYSDALVISSFGTANAQCALAFASQYGAGQSQRYRDLLSEMHSSKIFYNQWTNDFYTTSNPSDLKNTLVARKPLIVVISHYGSIEQFIKTLKNVTQKNDISFEKIFSNKKMESIYKIEIN